MCRLFAQLSAAPASAERLLVASDFSLLKQSNFSKKNLQRDGWGIAHFGNNGRPVVSKSSKPAFQEKAAFRRAAEARSRAIIGHIRAASNPRGLPKRRLINMANTQPFTDGRWVFAHNGTLQIPLEIAAELGPLRRKLRSHNDSEVYFWQFIKFLRKTGDPRKALAACVREDWRVWKKCRSRHPDKKSPYTSLNVMVTDGKSLHAFCHFVARGRADCGVCNPTQPWGVMSWSRRGETLVAASENLDRGRWTRFRQPEIVSAEIVSGRLRMSRQRLKELVP